MVATRLAPDAAESLVSTLMAWLVSQGPVEVSGWAVGLPTTVGVRVLLAVRPKPSVTW